MTTTFCHRNNFYGESFNVNRQQFQSVVIHFHLPSNVINNSHHKRNTGVLQVLFSLLTWTAALSKHTMSVTTTLLFFGITQAKISWF